MPTYNPIALSRTASDTDASAFFAACVTAGTTLSAGQQSAIQLLVQGMKQTGLWTKMTAVYPFIGGTAGTHAINLKTPGTYNIQNAANATWTSGVTHNSNGVTGNGSTGYGDTGINANTVLSLNSSHLSVYSRTNSAANAIDIGCWAATPRYFYIYCRYTNNNMYGSLGQNTDSNYPTPDSFGLHIASRTSSSLNTLYKSGRKIGASSIASISIPSLNIFICSGNQAGSVITPSSRNLSFASIGSGLSDQDAQNLSTLVQAYQSSLGRAV